MPSPTMQLTPYDLDRSPARPLESTDRRMPFLPYDLPAAIADDFARLYPPYVDVDDNCRLYDSRTN